ncbi:hypothetical protein Golomagni_03302 [Golovinomyces magnicellulatus]|nr:hypothetical protein Golomagni_03302 [Golovinomyces magnicellulatus]
MAIIRSVSVRSYSGSVRQAFSRPQLFRPFARRGFANIQSKKSKAGGDAVWFVASCRSQMSVGKLTRCRAAGSIAVTIPACWYLLSNRTTNQDHHGDHEENNKILDNKTKELEFDESEDVKEESGENVENEAKKRDIGASNEPDNDSNITSQTRADEDITLKQPDEPVDPNTQSDKLEDSCDENTSHPNTTSGSSE